MGILFKWIAAGGGIETDDSNMREGVMFDIEKLRPEYTHLYDRFVNYKESVASFLGRTGNRYYSQEIRFMLVGRAVNGWENMSVENENKFLNNVINNANKGLSWIKDVNSRPGNGEGYFLDNSAFWTYARKGYADLVKKRTANDWFQDIAWTNLYKMAPKGKNPYGETKIWQNENNCSLNILGHEIEVFNPTHIHFETGYDRWFIYFRELCTDYKDFGKNISRGKNKNNIFVEGAGHIGSAKAVVACRPEGRNKDLYTTQIKEVFSAL